MLKNPPVDVIILMIDLNKQGGFYEKLTNAISPEIFERDVSISSTEEIEKLSVKN